MNLVILQGNVGMDAELKPAGNHQKLRLRVATNRKWKSKQSGEMQEHTEWHTVIVWGKQAENLGRKLRKGSKVLVKGRLETSTYEKDGQTRYSTEINAEHVTMLDSKPQGGGQSDGGWGSTGKKGGGDDFGDDNVPF